MKHIGYKQVIYILFFLLILLCLFIPGKAVKVGEVYCSSQLGPCNENLNNKLSQSRGLGVGLAKKRIQKVLSDDIFVSQYNLYFRLPNKIVIDIIEKKPRFGITNISRSKFSNVGSDGEVLSVEKQINLPYLIIEGDVPEVGKNITEEHLFALNIVSDLKKIYDVNEGRIEGESLVIELASGLRVIFPMKGDRDLLVGSLVLIAGKLEESGELGTDKKIATNTLDLRYNDPVLK